MKTQTRKEKLDDIRWRCILIALLIVAPHIEVIDLVAWAGIFAFVFVRESVVSAIERLWLFITRQ